MSRRRNGSRTLCKLSMPYLVVFSISYYFTRVSTVSFYKNMKTCNVHKFVLYLQSAIVNDFDIIHTMYYCEYFLNDFMTCIANVSTDGYMFYSCIKTWIVFTGLYSSYSLMFLF